MKAFIALACLLLVANAQLLRNDKMNLGKYNPETKKYEKVMLGGDDHDLQHHGQVMLGGDDHDLQHHGQVMLGVDDHDLQHHVQPLLGADGHDLVPHDKIFLGGDDHDKKAYKKLQKHAKKHQKNKKNNKKMFGEDKHDMKPHGKKMLGGGDHDYKPHGKKMLGSGDHDYKLHGKKQLGRDDHDLQLHYKKPLIGGGDHDYKPHGKTLLGSGDHDYKPHSRPLIGGGDHDYKPHGKTLLGSGNHDYKLHSRVLIGGGEHNYKSHNKKLIGGGDHDYTSHGKKSQNKKEHKKRNNAKKYVPDTKKKSRKQHMLGKDKHDFGHIGAFHTFMKTHNRSYTNQGEFKKRFNVFRDNMRSVRIMQQNERGTAKYGPTKFSDWTETEFRKLHGFRQHLKPAVSKLQAAVIPEGKIPDSLDWRQKNVVTPIKNQGACGSCWAFSTTGNIEGQWAIKHQKLYSLSEQELVDCDSEDHGCEGGLPENAYDMIEKLGGLETEADYPYDGKDDQCSFDKTKVKVQVNGSEELPQDEEQLAQWLVHNGPISIGINAAALQFYMGGVSHPYRFLCSPENLNHGMLIVGYGIHAYPTFNTTLPFWIVKNSWGEQWGEQGYYRVYRGDGTCGVNRMATSAIVP